MHLFQPIWNDSYRFASTEKKTYVVFAKTWQSQVTCKKSWNSATF